ncbi:MAG TPA: dihydrodipicolinate synthase family protein [Firmicutes bacterium]|nr:dihydrodipicolinate synthase family protein [Bacillota bacterium]
MRPEGVIVPLITPVDEQGRLDETGLCRLIEHLVGGGISHVFPAGTTGEFARLSDAVRHELFRLTVKYSRGRAKVYAGISDTSLEAVLDHLRAAEAAGVDACVLSLPYYYPASPSEAVRWFSTVLEATELPVVLYNIPGNVGQILAPEVVERLADKVAGLKDSGGDPDLMKRYLKALGGQGRTASFLAGSEEVLTEAVSLGADGVVPSMANVFPHLWSLLWEYRQDPVYFPSLAKLVNRVNELNSAFSSPIGSILWKKRLLALQGICLSEAVFPANALDPSFDERLQHTRWEVERVIQWFRGEVEIKAGG